MLFIHLDSDRATHINAESLLCAADEELPQRGRGPDLQEEQRAPARDSARPGALPHHARQVKGIHTQIFPPFFLGWQF